MSIVSDVSRESARRGRQNSSEGEQREEDAGPDEEASDQEQHQPRTESVPADQHHPRLRASFRHGELRDEFFR